MLPTYFLNVFTVLIPTTKINGLCKAKRLRGHRNKLFNEFITSVGLGTLNGSRPRWARLHKMF